jgi:hypothetical protein
MALPLGRDPSSALFLKAHSSASRRRLVPAAVVGVFGSGGGEIALVERPPSEGFTTLWSHHRLDMTVEARVLRDEFEGLFTDDDRQRARDRLALYGWADDRSPAPPDRQAAKPPRIAPPR